MSANLIHLTLKRLPTLQYELAMLVLKSVNLIGKHVKECTLNCFLTGNNNVISNTSPQNSKIQC